MQYQTIVRDASAPGDPLVTGYWCWGAYHWQIGAETLTSLMLHPYSPAQPGFESENRCWVQCLHALRQVTDGRGIWLHDRGGDRPEILSAFLRLQPRWIIRLREDRALIGPDGTVRPAGVWADWALAHRPERGRAVTLLVRLPPQDVSQPSCPPPLWLVVPTYTYGNDQRWVLLTCGLIDRHVGPRQVRHCYGGRWQGEDGKRFLGQLWHVEQFLTRSFLGLERMAWCVVAASGFVAKLQREEPELAAALEQEVVYWDKPVKLPGYRVARGLQHWAAAHGLAVVWN
jgi:hypothetical protein